MSKAGRAQMAKAKWERRKSSDAALLAQAARFAASMLMVGEHDNLKDAIKDAARYSLDGVGGARKLRLMKALEVSA